MDASVKKIILISIASIAGLCLLLAIGLYVYFILQFGKYQDDRYKFSIKYPKSWQLIVNPKPNVLVMFMRPKDTALDTFQENFTVVIQPVSDQDQVLETFTGHVKNQMMAVFGGNIKIVREKSLQWDWRQGHEMVFEGPAPDYLKMISAWVLRENQAYILTFTGIKNKDPQDDFVVDEMVKSFQLL